MRSLMIFALALFLSTGLFAQEITPDNETIEKAFAVPSTIDFQGRLHDSGGSPVNATLEITFSLYDLVSGGTALWMETRSVQVTDGLFQLKLGEVTPLTPALFVGMDRWLGIKVGAEAEMSPRTKISSVGYAMQAAEGGLNLPYFGEGSVANAIFKIVNDDTSGSGIYGISHSTSPTSSLFGVRGDLFSFHGAGVVGAAFSDEGTSSGVHGQSQAINGSGVYGRNITNSPTGTSFGVYGVADGPTGTGVSGIAGYASGNTRGIRGMVVSPDGYSGYFEGGKFYVSGNTGIGTLNPVYKLDVVGSFRATGLTLQDGSQGAGKVLTSDANGLASWQTAPVEFSLPYSGDCSSPNAAFSINQSGTGQGIYVYNPAETGEVSSITAHNNSSSGTGIAAYMHSTSGTTIGILGYTISPAGRGVLGLANATTGANYGVIGRSQSVEGVGVYGQNLSSTGMTYGIQGSVSSPQGYSGYFLGGSFYVSGNTGIGTAIPSAKLEVNGQVKITGGGPGAGKVLTSDANGLATWQTAAGLILPFSASGSASTNNPVFEVTNTGTGNGIRGIASSGDGHTSTIGVIGESSGSPGLGVMGYATSSTGQAWGVYGYSMSESGRGVYGFAADLTGINYAVYGTCLSPSGYSGYFEGPRFYISGNLGIGVTSPSAKLDVYGQIKLWGSSNPGAGKVLTSDATGLASWATLPANPWEINGSNIYYNNGNAGIGTNSPRTKLEIAAITGPHLIIHDSNGSNDRPGIQFTNNNIHFIGGDDLSEEIFGIYSQYGHTRTYAARLNIHGPATANWGKLLSLTHDGNHGRISTDAGYLVLEPAGMRVGIGTDAPTQSLDVNGTLRVRGMTTGTSAGTVYRTADGTLITGASDIRLKENIETLRDGLAKILQLRGVSFSWKNDPAQARNIGFIAQEFEQVIPELVFTNPVDGYKGINYAELSAVLVEAMKTQQDKIDLLEQQNHELNTRLERLERALESLGEK